MDILQTVVTPVVRALGVATILSIAGTALALLTSFFDFPKIKITFRTFVILFVIFFIISVMLIWIFDRGTNEPPPTQNESIPPSIPSQSDPVPPPSVSVETNSPEEAKPTETNTGSGNPEPSSENPGDDFELDTVALEDVPWLVEDNIHRDNTATTTRGETWSDCIRFGSSNINADGASYIVAVCDQKYSKFTAKIAPQKGFDRYEVVTLYICGVCIDNDEFIFKQEYQISNSTKSFEVELDITGVDDLRFYTDGNYSLARIAGTYTHEYTYTGMGVLMCDAVLYK